MFLTFFHVRLEIMGNWQQVVVSRHFSLRFIYRVRLAGMCFMDREDVTAPFCLANSRYLLRIYACFCSECRRGLLKSLPPSQVDQNVLDYHLDPRKNIGYIV